MTEIPTPTEEKEVELEALLEQAEPEELSKVLTELEPSDQRRVFSILDTEDRVNTIETLVPEDAAEVLDHLPESQAADILEELPAIDAAEIIDVLPASTGSEILREMDEPERSAILDNFTDEEEKQDLEEHLAYPVDSAGALMSERVLRIEASQNVRDALELLSEKAEKFSDRDIQYAYVVKHEKLVGVLPLRRLALSGRTQTAGDLMIPDPEAVNATAELAELVDFFDGHGYLGAPVVDDEKRLLGVVSRDVVREAQTDSQTGDFLRASGITAGEELRSLPLRTRSFRRLCWLVPNILLNLLAASVIMAFQGTLEAVIVLAAFLPIVSDMSGCSGNQAVAVSIRELSLGILRPGDFLRIFVKEGLVGIINGTAVGIVLGLIAGVWTGRPLVGLVVGGALFLNTILSVLIGGLVPLLLKRFKVDPALASSPILTTCTDMCGFFLVLGIASVVLL
ncbi:MAG: magnesium transporter [Verrucomicrobiota bacterium]